MVNDTVIGKLTNIFCIPIVPLPEGNGRTQRVFLTQLIRQAGYDIEFGNMDMEELMIATIHAANGVTDYLEKIFRDTIKLK